ncbi:MAG: RNA polymerase sigma factor RpoD/SigA [Candidatus Omnitrophota bacterium]
MKKKIAALKKESQRQNVNPVRNMEAIKAYLEKIKNLPLLTKIQEQTLIQNAKEGDRESRRQVINCNLRLVVSIAKHYSHFDLPLMDLIAEGNIGLMRAIDKFNPSKGFRFSTYAAWWIRQSVTRALIDQGKTIRIPVYLNEQFYKYKKTKEALRQDLNREPTRQELSKKLRLPQERISEIELWIQKKSSLDAPIGDDGESQLGDFLKSKDYADTTKVIDGILKRERVDRLLHTISEKERTVLDLRFGITDGKPRTLADIAKRINVSRERIRQIEKLALKKLKDYAHDLKKEDL